MKKYSIVSIALVAMFALISISNAQYWFQSGVQGDYRTINNYGARVAIQMINPQYPVEGSLAYWVGETLSNGAFIQVGYEVPNATGQLPESCNAQECNGTLNVTAGSPTWFWEYFPSGSNGTGFYGGVGVSGLSMKNGTFNRFAFNSSGDTWRAYVNGNEIGSVDLGTSQSGPNPPIAIAEYANTNSNNYQMPNLIFRNLKFYNGTAYVQVPSGYSLISYGKGSDKYLPNTYGVQELANRTDYFETGSGLPDQNAAQLWNLGYEIYVNSTYGNVTGSDNYSALAEVRVSVPKYVNLSSGERASFAGWEGSGKGSYTGGANNATVLMNGNIVENAKWDIQYLVNATTNYGSLKGSGWFDANSTANVSVVSSIVSIGVGERASFLDWSNGGNQSTEKIFVDKPTGVSANWALQYLINATTQYGNVTGTGWYDAGSTAKLSLTAPIVNATQNTRTAFESWSNGNTSSTLSVRVTSPESLSATYSKQYLLTLDALDEYGAAIGASAFIVNGNKTQTSFFVYPDKTYNVEYGVYKGVNVTAGAQLSGITGPTTEDIKLQVYNVTIRAATLFNIPLNASLNVTFKNSTHVATFTGSSGSVTFRDVPYGYVYGYENYLGETRSVSISNGGVTTPVFITPSVIALIFIALGLIFLTEQFYFREKEKSIHLSLSSRSGRNSIGK